MQIVRHRLFCCSYARDSILLEGKGSIDEITQLKTRTTYLFVEIKNKKQCKMQSVCSLYPNTNIAVCLLSLLTINITSEAGSHLFSWMFLKSLKPFRILLNLTVFPWDLLPLDLNSHSKEKRFSLIFRLGLWFSLENYKELGKTKLISVSHCPGVTEINSKSTCLVPLWVAKVTLPYSQMIHQISDGLQKFGGHLFYNPRKKGNQEVHGFLLCLRCWSSNDRRLHKICKIRLKLWSIKCLLPSNKAEKTNYSSII